MEMIDTTRLLLGIVVVGGLLVLLAWSARRLDLPTRLGTSAGTRLAISESRWIDGKNRLVLIRLDDTEHLLLIGPAGGTVIGAARARRSPLTPTGPTPTGPTSTSPLPAEPAPTDPPSVNPTARDGAPS